MHLGVHAQGLAVEDRSHEMGSAGLKFDRTLLVGAVVIIHRGQDLAAFDGDAAEGK